MERADHPLTRNRRGIASNRIGAIPSGNSGTLEMHPPGEHVFVEVIGSVVVVLVVELVVLALGVADRVDDVLEEPDGLTLLLMMLLLAEELTEVSVELLTVDAVEVLTADTDED